MIDSGRMPIPKDPSPDHLSKYLKEGMIPEKYLSEINDVYMEILPEHSRIVADCEQMHHRVNVYRKKAKFPKRAYWTPPGRELNEEKKLFLQGLSAQVAFLKMATIKDCCTGRVVEYAAVSESQCKHSRICCCYVTLTNKAQSSPHFGQIVSLNISL